MAGRHDLDFTPLHALFGQHKFNSIGSWETIIPALKLCSRLLESPQALHYFYTIFFGINERLHDVEYARDIWAEAVHSGKKVRDLTLSDIQAVQTKLNDLASMIDSITFHHFESDDINGKTQAVLGSEKMSDDPAAFQGKHCHIMLTARYLQIPSDAAKDRANQFSIAVTIIHELGHAAQLAVNGANRAEDFFEDSFISELGCEIIARIFGAVYMHGPHTSVACWAEWPNAMVLQAYRRVNPPRVQARHEDQIPKKEEAKQWEVPDGFVEALFETEFWEVEMRVRGPLALVPQTIRESVWRCMRFGERIPVPVTVADLFAQDESEDDVLGSVRNLFLEDPVPAAKLPLRRSAEKIEHDELRLRMKENTRAGWKLLVDEAKRSREARRLHLADAGEGESDSDGGVLL